MADYEHVEEMVKKAAGQFRWLPKAAPDGHRGYWPEYISEYKKVKSQGPIEPVDIDLMDQVLDMMLNAPLTKKQRLVVWSRVRGGKIRGWRSVGRQCGCSHEWARNVYSDAMQILSDWLLSGGYKD